jgi:hypothetical protein
MNRLARVFPVVLLAAGLAACTDKSEQPPTAPKSAAAPGGPSRSVADDAGAGTARESSICISYRATRDEVAAQVAAAPGDAELKANLDSWNAAIADMCE